MKKVFITILLLLIVLLGLINFQLNNTIDLKDEKIKTMQNENENLYQELTEANCSILEYKSIMESYSQIGAENADYVYYDIPLNKDQQILTQNLCEYYGLEYTLVLGLLKAESNFTPNLLSKTNDGGIAQINLRYSYWYAELAGLKEYNVYNIEDGIKMCLAGLSYYKKHWESKGITDENLLTLCYLNSYNQGISKFTKYIKENNTYSRKYDKIIFKYKKQLETDGHF